MDIARRGISYQSIALYDMRPKRYCTVISVHAPPSTSAEASQYAVLLDLLLLIVRDELPRRIKRRRKRP